MPLLLFYVGKNCYSIDNQYVLRIVPKVLLKKIPHAKDYLAGILNLRGKLIPVIDFCQLIEQRATQDFMHSRIILLQDTTNSDSERVVGILGEKVEEILNLKSELFNKTDFLPHHFPYLDKVYSDDKRFIQHLNVGEFFRFLSIEVFKIVDKEEYTPST